MITYYKTDKYSYEIKPVIATSVTDKTITLAEQGTGWARTRSGRVSLHSSCDDYWKTEEEAKAHLRERAIMQITSAQKLIASAEKALAALA